MAASCPPSYSWAKNAQGLDPCAAASKLINKCDQSEPPLRPIHNHEQYPRPSANKATQCSCSVPVYALVAACADCQRGFFSTWNDWSAQCSAILLDYPLSPDTSIPDWAKINVDVQPSFDPEVALKSIANGSTDDSNSNTTSSIPPSSISSNATSASSTLASISRTTSSSVSSQTLKQASSSAVSSVQDTVSAIPTRIGSFATDGIFSTYTQASDSQSTTLSNSSGDGSSNSDTASSTDALGSEKKGGSNAGAIAGGVIGGLVLLAILGAAMVWWLRRRRRSRIAPSAAYLATYGATRPRTSLSTHPFATRTESIAMSQNNSNSVSSYYDEEVVRDSLYSNTEKPRYMHVPMSSPAFRGS